MNATCDVVAFEAGNGLHALRFVLHNRGAADVEVPTYEPFTAFTVLATANGEPLEVHQPALDIGVNATTLHVPAGGAVTLGTPIRLRIAEGADRGNDGFVWTIAHAKDGLSLTVQLDLPEPFALRCPLSFRP